MKRARSEVTPQEVMVVLEPLATDRSFIKYDESDKVQDSKLHTDKITVMHPLLAGLYELDDKLSFKKSVLSSAFAALFAKKNVTWGMSEKFEAAWVKSMTNRVANACRQVTQGMMKPKHPPWVEQLPWMAGLAKSATVAATTEAKPGDTDGKSAYFFGFDTEVRNAFRCGVATPDKKELANEMYKPEGAASHDPVCARWSDGMEHIISDMSCSDLDKVTGGRVSDKQPSKVFFDEEMKDTHHRVTVKPRVDRSMLCSLYEQSKQVLQIPVKLFGPEDSEDAMDKAAKMMIILAKQFCNNELKRADLKDARNKLLKTIVPYKPPKGAKASTTVLKKPAAARKAGIKTEPAVKPEIKDEPDDSEVLTGNPVPEDGDEEEALEEEEEEQEDDHVQEDGMAELFKTLEQPPAEQPKTPPITMKRPASSSATPSPPVVEHSPEHADMPEPPTMTMVETMEMFSRSHLA
jgi:hypothetical protein